MKVSVTSASALVVLICLGSCDRLKTTGESGNETPRKHESAAKFPPSQPYGDQQRGGESRDQEKWAMNKNAEMRAFYSQPPPPWLNIGKPVTTHIGSRTDPVKWTRRMGSSMKENFSDRKRVTTIASGKVRLPEVLSDIPLRCAMVNDAATRALISKYEYHLTADVYDIKDGIVVASSIQPVPVINFDDDRRWHISWESWIDESTIVGMMEEEDPKGEGPVRVAIYLYNTSKRELRRVVAPEALKPGRGEGIAIAAVAPDALLIATGIPEKKHVLLIED